MPAELFIGVGVAVVKLFLRAADEGNAADGVGDAADFVSRLLSVKSSDPQAKKLAAAISASVEHDLKRHRTPSNDLRSAGADVQSLLERLHGNHEFILYAGRYPSHLFEYTKKNFAGDYRKWISRDALRTFDRCLESALRELAKLIPSSPSFQYAALLSLMDSTDEMHDQQAEILRRASQLGKVADTYLRDRQEARIVKKSQTDELAKIHLARVKQLLQRQIDELNYIEDSLPLLTFRSSPSLDTGCVDLLLTNIDGTRVSRDELISRENTRVTILRAPAGSGKSVTLRQIALKQARSALSEPTIETVRLPVYIDLGKGVWDMRSSEPSAVLSQALGVKDAEWFDSLLETGRVALYIDGIDKLDAYSRRHALVWCETVANYFIRNGMPITVALRPHAEFPPGPLSHEIRIEPMGAISAQALTIKLLDRMLPIRSGAPEPRGSLLNSILSTLWRPEMRALRENPLLCALVVWQTMEDGVTQSSIVVTVEEALSVVLSAGVEPSPRNVISNESLRATCEALAFHFYRMNTENAALPILLNEVCTAPEGGRAPLQRIDARLLIKSLMAVGLVESAEDGQIGFRYPTFRVFLAGYHMSREPNGLLAAEAQGLERIDEFRWAFLATSTIGRAYYVRSFLSDAKRRSEYVRLFLLSAALAIDTESEEFRPDITRLLSESRQELARLPIDQIATLSDLVLPALEKLLTDPLSQCRVSTVVRTIIRIGTDEAFALIRRVDSTIFIMCAEILLEGWQDALHYAYGREILGRYVRDVGRGSVIATSPANIRHSELLPDQILVLGRFVKDAVLPAGIVPRAIEFCSYEEWAWERFSAVARRSTHVRRVRLVDPVGNCEGVDWAVLTELESLTVISSEGAGRSIFRIEALGHLPKLRKVRLCGLNLSGSKMHLPVELESLILENCEFVDVALPTVSGGGQLVEIQWDDFRGPDLFSIHTLKKLQRIHMPDAKALQSTVGIASLFPLLEELVITGCLSLTNIEGVSDLKHLDLANFEDCWNLPEKLSVFTSRTFSPLGYYRPSVDTYPVDHDEEQEWERYLDEQWDMPPTEPREDRILRSSLEDDEVQSRGCQDSDSVPVPEGSLEVSGTMRSLWGNPNESRDPADVVLEGLDTYPGPAQRNVPHQSANQQRVPADQPGDPWMSETAGALEEPLRHLGENIYKCGGGPDDRLGRLLSIVDTLRVAYRSYFHPEGLIDALEDAAIAVEGEDELQKICEGVHFTSIEGGLIDAALRRGMMSRGGSPI